MPGYLTSQRIYNPIYLKTRISSLLEYILRGICSSHAVPWKTRDSGDFPILSIQTEREVPPVGEYLFDEVLVSQAGDRLQGDVSLKSNIMLDTLAKKSQAPKDRTLSPAQAARSSLYPFGFCQETKTKPSAHGPR